MTFLLSIFNYTMLNMEPDERLNNEHKFLARLSSPRTPAPTSNSHTPTNRSWPPYITLALSIAKLVLCLSYLFGGILFRRAQQFMNQLLEKVE
ncbi:hypothetical protein F2Q69_00048678 [Brassica cretica]|uniref:Uncharacterized protein n=1 Tax=Brassica cretica TaxID=69181 RepID=A0A8S9PL31_BRACR|nr:hypothetical protein F2Q69_00048678 [Brassica cretica]